MSLQTYCAYDCTHNTLLLQNELKRWRSQNDILVERRDSDSYDFAANTVAEIGYRILVRLPGRDEYGVRTDAVCLLFDSCCDVFLLFEVNEDFSAIFQREVLLGRTFGEVVSLEQHLSGLRHLPLSTTIGRNPIALESCTP